MNRILIVRFAGLWGLGLALAALVSPGTLPAQDNKAAAAESAKGQKWALLIGVNDYIRLKDLKYCQRDAEALRGALTGAGFPKENVFLMASGAKDAKNQPFKANIQRQLKVVLGMAEEGDMVLVSFSGHGIHSSGQTYLCPSEADEGNPTRTMIPLNSVFDALEECAASQKMFWVDACRNDPRRSGSREAHARSLQGISRALASPPEGVLVLASCKEGQVSWELEDFQHGVFVHYLLEGISGKADRQSGDRNDRVSLLELYKYANINTKRLVADKWGELQTPELFGRITGDFEIAEAGYPSLVTNSIGMKLKLIPAGEFLMGSSESAEAVAKAFAKYDAKPEWFEDEHPQHRVKISQPFYLGVHEVTVGQFRRFVNDNSYKTEAEKDGEGGGGWNEVEGKFEGRDPKYTWRNTGFKQDDEHPVVNVSWNDAVAFCQWLSRKERQQYRLPTEAEWEYACRAETTTRYYSGNDPEGLVRVANTADGTAKSKFSGWKTIAAKDGYVFTAPVGRFQVNGFGLCDMHGNVWEWCADWYEKDYYSKSPSLDPKGPSAADYRVLRGGSFNYWPNNARSALRYRDTPVDRYFSNGFRIARTL